jgi:hypothetical protein
LVRLLEDKQVLVPLALQVASDAGVYSCLDRFGGTYESKMNPDLVSRLLAAGFKEFGQWDYNGFSPFLHNCLRGNEEMVVWYIRNQQGEKVTRQRHAFTGQDCLALHNRHLAA